MSKFYKQALSIVADGAFDAQKVAVRLAQENPSLFLKFCGVQVEGKKAVVPHWFINTVVLVAKTNPVGAIKNLREKTRLGLWDAKQIVDEWRGGMGGDPKFLSRIIGNEIPEWAGKTWNDLVAAAKKEML